MLGDWFPLGLFPCSTTPTTVLCEVAGSIRPGTPRWRFMSRSWGDGADVTCRVHGDADRASGEVVGRVRQPCRSRRLWLGCDPPRLTDMAGEPGRPRERSGNVRGRSANLAKVSGRITPRPVDYLLGSRENAVSRSLRAALQAGSTLLADTSKDKSLSPSLSVATSALQPSPPARWWASFPLWEYFSKVPPLSTFDKFVFVQMHAKVSLGQTPD